MEDAYYEIRDESLGLRMNFLIMRMSTLRLRRYTLRLSIDNSEIKDRYSEKRQGGSPLFVLRVCV